MLQSLRANFRLRFDDWVDRRLEISDTITTNHRRTYVLPNRFGYLLLLIVLLMLIAATNYQNSLAFVLTFVMMALGFNNLIISYRNLIDLELRVYTTSATFVGEPLDIPLSIRSKTARGHYSIGLGKQSNIQRLVDVLPSMSVETKVTFWPESRGWFVPGRFYLLTSYPLGLLKVWTWFRCQQRYLVYPEPKKPPEALPLSGWNESRTNQDYQAGQDDFLAIREYQKGDSRRDIHWRAYARDETLVTKLYSEPRGDQSVFDFEMFDAVDAYQRTELRLSWLCYLVLEASRQHQTFALKLASKEIAPGSGPAHRDQCLKALALYGAEQ